MLERVEIVLEVGFIIRVDRSIVKVKFLKPEIDSILLARNVRVVSNELDRRELIGIGLHDLI